MKLRRKMFFHVVAVTLTVAAACDTETVGEDRRGLDESAPPHDVAWEGGDRPGLDVWAPRPEPLPRPSVRIRDRIAERESGQVVVVRGTVAAVDSLDWDPAPSWSPWQGRHVVTRLQVSVEESVCGDVPRTIEVYLRGGKTASLTQVGPDFPFDLAAGDERVFVLGSYSSNYVLRDGGMDLLETLADGALKANDGELLVSSDIGEVCP